MSVIVSSGNSPYDVPFGQTDTGDVVISGGSMFVLSGGVADTTTVDANGKLTVDSSGTANGTTVSSGGVETVNSGGYASGTTISSGGFNFVYGSETHTTDSGGILTVFGGGTANNLTISSGGTLNVLGKITSNVKLYSGSIENISSGGSATGVPNSGTGISGGTLNVLSGGESDHTTVFSGGSLNVSSGGTAYSVTVSSGGSLNIQGTFVSSLQVSAGGSATVSSGGLLSGTGTSGTGLFGGTLNVLSGGTADLVEINSGGLEVVSSGGTISNTIVASGGKLELLGGAQLGNTPTVRAGATLEIGSGYTSNGYVVSSGVTLEVAPGGTATNTTVLAGGVLDYVSGANVTGTTGAGAVNELANVTSITASPSTELPALAAGATVSFTVDTSAPVTVNTTGGSPTLSLNDGGVATFDAAASTPTAGVFTYTVQAGDNTAELQVTGINLNGSTIIDGSGNNLYIETAPTNPSGPEIEGTLPTMDVVINGVVGEGAPVQGNQAFDQFLGFGDSNTDSGYFFTHTVSYNSTLEAQYQAAVAAGGGLPTSIGGVMNSVLLAQDYGLTAIPVGEPGGTNYAASGATVTGQLSGSLAPSVVSQIQTYLASTGGVADPNALYLISGGGNDAKIAETLVGTTAQDNYMIQQANSLAAAVETLYADGARYIIDDDQSGSGTLGAIFAATLWTDLAQAGVPFIADQVKELIKAIDADPSAYGITNIVDPPAGPFTASNPYNSANGGSNINPDPSLIAKGWAYYSTSMVSSTAGQTYLWADDEHLTAAGQQIEANSLYSEIQNAVPTVSETLTASPRLVGNSFDENTANITYQWQSLSSGQTTWVNITGATNTTYVVQPTDLGDQLRVEASYTDNAGQTATTESAPTLAVINAICFMRGTAIRTPHGACAVEMLKRGDMVLTANGQATPVHWIGHHTISMQFADPLRVLPIRIKAGALADNIPSRDLLLSPDHAIFVGDVLIQAGALVNGTSIVRETDVPDIFTYFHVELDDHSLILAENTPAETFIDNVERFAFDNWEEHKALYPEGKPIVEMPYPRAKAHRQVPRAIREKLAERAMILFGVAQDVAA